jgi:hypothetical protein
MKSQGREALGGREPEAGGDTFGMVEAAAFCGGGAGRWGGSMLAVSKGSS